MYLALKAAKLSLFHFAQIGHPSEANSSTVTLAVGLPRLMSSEPAPPLAAGLQAASPRPRQIKRAATARMRRFLAIKRSIRARFRGAYEEGVALPSPLWGGWPKAGWGSLPPRDV